MIFTGAFLLGPTASQQISISTDAGHHCRLHWVAIADRHCPGSPAIADTGRIVNRTSANSIFLIIVRLPL
jgi:hypothetical protein